MIEFKNINKSFILFHIILSHILILSILIMKMILFFVYWVLSDMNVDLNLTWILLFIPSVYIFITIKNIINKKFSKSIITVLLFIYVILVPINILYIVTFDFKGYNILNDFSRWYLH